MSACGTVAGYAAHRRVGEKACDACKHAWRGYHRRRRRDETVVRCQHCREEVEACEGEFGVWMHTATRRERGDDGHLAEGEVAA